MPEANVKMRAFAPLDDPYAGHVAAGADFETSEVQAKFYRKANWAGAPGEDSRDIQLSIAAQEIEERQNAKQQMSTSRQTFRNLTLAAAERGNVAAVDVMPQSVRLPEGERPRTNAQLAAVAPSSGSSSGSGESSGESSGEESYEEKSVPELRQIAKDRGIEGYSGANKPELIEKLKADDEGRE